MTSLVSRSARTVVTTKIPLPTNLAQNAVRSGQLQCGANLVSRSVIAVMKGFAAETPLPTNLAQNAVRLNQLPHMTSLVSRSARTVVEKITLPTNLAQNAERIWSADLL